MVLSTELVAIVGTVATLVGTLGAAVASPCIAEKMRRESTLREQFRDRRLELYADLLRITARIADNAQTWAATPTAHLEENEPDELDRINSRADVLASEKVHCLVQDFVNLAHTFHRTLSDVQIHHQRLHDAGVPDDETSIKQRLDLADMAVGLWEGHKELRANILREIRT